MVSPLVYSELGVAAVTVVLLTWRLSPVSGWIQRRRLTFLRSCRRHLLLTWAVGRLGPVGPWSVAWCISLVVYIALNGFCLGFRASSPRQVSARSGELALLTLIPLFLGWHAGFASYTCAVSLSAYLDAHAVLGLMAAVLTLIHVGIWLALSATGDLTRTAQVHGIIAVCAVAAAAFAPRVLTYVLTRGMCVGVHRALAVLGAYAVWRHTTQFASATYLVTALVTIFGLFVGAECMWTVFHNVRLRYRGRAVVMERSHITWSEQDGLLRLRVHVATPLGVKPVGHVHVYIPWIHLWASHPVMVASIDKSRRHIDTVIVQETDLSRRLRAHCQRPTTALSDIPPGQSWVNTVTSTSCSAFVLGPHGGQPCLHDYAEVFLVVEGAGILAVLSTIAHILHAYSTKAVRTRHVRVLWQLCAADYEMAKPFITELLREDGDRCKYILDFRLYLVGTDSDDGSRWPVGHHDRVCVLRQRLQLNTALEPKFPDLDTTKLVGVSASTALQREVVAYIRSTSDNLAYFQYDDWE